MSLLDPASPSDPAVVREIIRGLVGELRERARQVGEYAALPAAAESRRWTVLGLVEDVLAIADSRPVESLAAPELRRLANLLYDTELVAAEYTKLFFRDPDLAPPTPPVRRRTGSE
jgi:hypothetical protein